MAMAKEEDQKRREEAVRGEMEAYYRGLMKEAERREVRVKWRERRMDLRSSRIKFWRDENKKTQEILKQAPTAASTSEKRISPIKELPGKTRQSWKSVRVVEDEMKNVTLVLEDEESNVISEAVSNLGQFSTDLRERILTQSFASLPEWAQDKLLDNIYGDSSQDDEEIVFKKPIVVDTQGLVVEEEAPSTFIRRSSITSSVKRKRPDSFVESSEKRKEPSEGEEQVGSSRKKPANEVSLEKKEQEAYVSLAAALTSKSDEDLANANVVKRRPKQLNVIDGRRRPQSKSIEEVLYPARFSQVSITPDSMTPVTPTRTEFKAEDDPGVKVRPYPAAFERLAAGKIETMASTMFKKKPKDPPDPQAFTPLSMLMENSILIPLRAQLKVVNSAILNYLLVDAKLMDHFKALRNYLLFHDGEFAHHLSTTLFNEINESGDILNRATLNRIVDNATMASTFANQDPLAVNVGFEISDKEDDEILSRLWLGYRTEWPVNIILTPEAISIYAEVFGFLLQLKKAAWGLEQVFFDLKSLSKFRLLGVSHAAFSYSPFFVDLSERFQSSEQFRRVHLMRHDMLNFVTITQNYITRQVLDVTWSEFMTEIAENVHSVDSLYSGHMKYLNRAMFR